MVTTPERALSVSDALEALEAVRDKYAGNVLFRGEARLYKSRLPSAARHTAREKAVYEAYSTNLMQHVYTELIRPHIQDFGCAPTFKGQFVGCRDLLGRCGYETYTELFWQIQALLQHYGRKSPWLDMTFEPRIALFFASCDPETSTLKTSGTGYVYYVPLAEIREDWSPAIDLRDTADMIAEIMRTTAERPRAQAAAAMRSAYPSWMDTRTTKFTCVRFRRTRAVELYSLSWLFPNEKLPERLDDSERRYLQFLQPIAETGMYDGEPVHGSFVTLCRKMLAERAHLLR